jgi:hypothetical protein
MAQTASIIYLVGIVISLLLFILFLVFYLREQPDKRNNLWLILSIISGILFLVFAGLSLYELFKPKRYFFRYPVYVESPTSMEPSQTTQQTNFQNIPSMSMGTSNIPSQTTSQVNSRNVSPMSMETSNILRTTIPTYEGSPQVISRSSPISIPTSTSTPSPSPQFYTPVSSPSQLYRQ